MPQGGLVYGLAPDPTAKAPASPSALPAATVATSLSAALSEVPPREPPAVPAATANAAPNAPNAARAAAIPVTAAWPEYGGRPALPHLPAPTRTVVPLPAYRRGRGRAVPSSRGRGRGHSAQGGGTAAGGTAAFRSGVPNAAPRSAADGRAGAGPGRSQGAPTPRGGGSAACAARGAARAAAAEAVAGSDVPPSGAWATGAVAQPSNRSLGPRHRPTRRSHPCRRHTLACRSPAMPRAECAFLLERRRWQHRHGPPGTMGRHRSAQRPSVDTLFGTARAGSECAEPEAEERTGECPVGVGRAPVARPPPLHRRRCLAVDVPHASARPLALAVARVRFGRAPPAAGAQSALAGCGGDARRYVRDGRGGRGWRTSWLRRRRVKLQEGPSRRQA